MTASDSYQDSDALAESIAETLAERGWCLTEDFLPPARVAELREQAWDLWRRGELRPAAVGRGSERRLRPEIRSDCTRWIDPLSASEAERVYLAAVEGLRLALNRRLFLGLFELEAHLALYPPGARYRRHLDQFQGEERRALSLVLYLNADWIANDGGALRIYTDADDETRYEEVLPLGGRLVSFLSDRFPHEVFPARRERLSVTGWLKRRGRGPN